MGTFDHKDFFEAAMCLLDILPGIEHHIIEDSGGFPAWENPIEVNALVADFLSKQGG